MQVEQLQDSLAEAAPLAKGPRIKDTRLIWIFDRFRSHSKNSTAMTPMHRTSLFGQKAGRRTSRYPARSISVAPSTKLRPTRESEVQAQALVRVTFYLGLWLPARKSPVRWWLRL